MGVLDLRITTKRDSATLSRFEVAGGKHEILQRIVNFLERINSGNELAQDSSNPPSVAISVRGNKAQAAGTITFTGASTANDTVLINGVTFTAVASGATGNQWNVGTTATTAAANLASAINASVTALVSGYVTAANLAGVLTITSSFYGTSGNQTTIAKGVDAGPVMTVSGARLTAGAEDATALTLNF